MDENSFTVELQRIRNTIREGGYGVKESGDILEDPYEMESIEKENGRISLGYLCKFTGEVRKPFVYIEYYDRGYENWENNPEEQIKFREFLDKKDIPYLVDSADKVSDSMRSGIWKLRKLEELVNKLSSN